MDTYGCVYILLYMCIIMYIHIYYKYLQIQGAEENDEQNKAPCV